MAKTFLDEIKDRSIYFIGCGGAGMAPLMMILHELGLDVSGSDMDAGYRTEQLINLGIDVNIGHSATNLPESDNPLIVYSSAIKDSNPELVAAKKRHWECISRGKMLAELAETYRRTVSISGSHGKTTVTAMLVHIMKYNGYEVGYFVGGQMADVPNCASGNGDIFICEVDESDGSHTLIDSHLGIITNVEDDHCWSVGGHDQLMENFRTYAAKAPKIIFPDMPGMKELFEYNPDRIILKPEDILDPNYFEGFDRQLFNSWGDYQLINAALAVEAAVELDVTFENAVKALNTFPGVDRRMTEHYKSSKFCLIEDYAHHPTEVKAALSTLRKRFPERQLCVLFQPHRYARLERYLEEFADTLSIADKIMVLPTFTAWTETSQITSKSLVDEIGRKAKHLNSDNWPKIAAYSITQCQPPAVLAVLGAGDIDHVIPELNKLLKK